MVPSARIFSGGRSTRTDPASARIEIRTVSPIESWAGSLITTPVNVGFWLAHPMAKLTTGTKAQIVMKGFEIMLVQRLYNERPFVYPVRILNHQNPGPNPFHVSR